jgi:hypothetical protein
MLAELRQLARTHSAPQVSDLKGIDADTLRWFTKDFGFTFRSVNARTFTAVEIASIKAVAEVEGFRFRPGPGEVRPRRPRVQGTESAGRHRLGRCHLTTSPPSAALGEQMAIL